MYFAVVNQAAINSIPKNPWSVSTNGTFILEPTNTLCIGTSLADCLAAPLGVTQINTPVQLFTNWIFDRTTDGLRLSFVNTTVDPSILYDNTYLAQLHPLIHFNNNGGIVIGPSGEAGVANLATLVGTPVNYVINGMWASTTSFAFVGDGDAAAFIDTVCHVLNGTICGKLMRTSLDDPGVMISSNLIIYGSVDYGAIAANLDAYIIFNGSMVVTDYKDAGKAQPCIPNPKGEPPQTPNIWMDTLTGTGSCTIYTARKTNSLPVGTCFQTSTALPSVFFSAPYSMITGHALQGYVDSVCSSSTGAPTTLTLGCTRLTATLSVYIRQQV